MAHLTLTTQTLKGVGKTTAEHLKTLGISSLQDLLFHLPRGYQDRTRICPIRFTKPDETVLIQGQITEVELGRKSLVCSIQDPTGVLKLRFFHFNKAQIQHLRTKPYLRCFGEIKRSFRGLEMFHPEYQTVDPNHPPPLANTLTPIYPSCKGLSQNRLRSIIQNALLTLKDDSFREYLTSEISLIESLRLCHAPKTKDLSLQALQRLAYEELTAHFLSLLQLRKDNEQHLAYPLKNKGLLRQAFIKHLPFSLTTAQQKVSQEIAEDLSEAIPMSRLLQGDVGSGKTLIAVLAALQAVENGNQTALMAPTEILAEQHYANLKELIKPLKVSVGFLTSHNKSEPLEDIIVGTHALFQKDVAFKKLALVIIDEQHRFGVDQRLAFRQKGIEQNYLPHQLVMTATPIPRSLTMVAYADMAHSILDELPAGRKPITTLILPNSRRPEVVERIRVISAEGKQVYWVCPLIEESEVLQCQAAEQTFLTLKAQLPQFNVALLHSRVKIAERQAIMERFKAGQIQVLVATTVIEVGVDVPNACLMIIENTERMGLAQLHQLRGRVGRGSQQSYCVLLYQSPLSETAKARLQAMHDHASGFALAEKDLEIRGPGEWLGTRQSGLATFKVADLTRDQAFLPKAQEAAKDLLNNHSECVDPLLKRWIGQKQNYGLV